MAGSLLRPAGTSSAVREAVEVAGRHAVKSDLDRRLPGEVVEALVAAGVARHFVPGRWGGRDGGFEELLDLVAALGEGCTSAAWVASVTAGAARMGACLPEDGQRELWSGGADTLVVGALNPAGRAVAVDGGWRLNGEWALVSGVDFADWALVCALPSEGAHNTGGAHHSGGAHNTGGAHHSGVPNQAESPFFFALPRRDFHVLDTWFNVGMRATGSNTLAVDDVFVPAHRGVARDAIWKGLAVGSVAPCHTAPLRTISGTLFAAPALGAARAAVRDWADRMAGRATPALHAVVARAEGEVDSAELLLRRVARAADERGDGTRSPRDCALAAELLVDAVERLFRSAGSSAQAQDEPLQRIWRDVHCVASHAALRFETAGGARGGQLLGTAGKPG